MQNEQINITPDSIVFWEYGPVTINATLVYTWVVMLILIVTALVITSRLKVKPPLSRWQIFLESLISVMRGQLRDILQQKPDTYLPFLGTLFIFISLSNLLLIVPRFRPPTGSLYTTSALAICVFLAVPYYGIRNKGLGGYLKQYITPTPIMLPFNIIGELSRTLALAVRLFGNIMSGSMIGAILLAIAPLVLPILMDVLGLLIGQIQAYIFAVLAAVYLGSAVRVREKEEEESQKTEKQRKGGV